MAEILIGEGHNGAAISGQAGDILVVRLPENPTTGFRWSMTQGVSSLLRLQSDDLESASAGVGGGGVRVFRFTLIAPGNTALTLQLARPWEATTPRSVFGVQIAVGR